MEVWQQDWSQKWALYSPDKIAVKEYESGRTLTYGELSRLGNRLAGFLKNEYGIEKGSRVAVLAEYSLEYIVLFAAAQKAGFVIVPLNYRLASAEIDYLMADSNPAIAIVEEKYNHLMHFPDGSVLELALMEKWLVPSAETAYDQDFTITPVEEDDPIFIIYTSGTTGFPKGALYTHKMLFWNSINTAISLIINTESRTMDRKNHQC